MRWALLLLALALPAQARVLEAVVYWSPAEVRPDFSLLPSTDIVTTTLACGAVAGQPEQRITVQGATAQTRVRYQGEQWCALEGVVLTPACDYTETGDPINCGPRPISTVQSQAFVLPGEPAPCEWAHSMPVPWGYPHPVLTRLCVGWTHDELTQAQVDTLRPLVAGMGAQAAADALNAPSALVVWDDAAPVSRLLAPPFAPSLWISISEPRRWLWDRLTAGGTVDATDPGTRQALRDVWANQNATRDLITERLQRRATVAEAALAGTATSPATLPWSGVLSPDEAANLTH